jgi:hypothetical protein
MDAILETVVFAEKRLKGRYAQAKYQSRKRAQTQAVEPTAAVPVAKKELRVAQIQSAARRHH